MTLYNTQLNNNMTETEWKRYNQLKDRAMKLFIKWGHKTEDAACYIKVGFDEAYFCWRDREAGVCRMTAGELARFIRRTAGVTGVQR